MNAPAPTRIKICGLRDKETIRAMDGLPIHEIGFVFAPSRRRVEPREAAALIAEAGRLKAAAGAPPRTVGVFVDAGLNELRETLAAAPLDVVQLHGRETPGLCKAVREELRTQVWKVFPVGEGGPSAAELFSPYEGAVDAIMIDTAGGGTGRAFDWERIGEYRSAARTVGVPLYVAGGLNPDNVRQLTENYTPDGVDVSSGVETDGIKDIGKIRLFVQRVIEQ